MQPDSAEGGTRSKYLPACVKRVGDIFDDLQFFVKKDTHVKGLLQGAEGNCWFISSLSCLCTETQILKLVEKPCPAEARDGKVGVYGFVFFRAFTVNTEEEDAPTETLWDAVCVVGLKIFSLGAAAVM